MSGGGRLDPLLHPFGRKMTDVERARFDEIGRLYNQGLGRIPFTLTRFIVMPSPRGLHYGLILPASGT